MIWKLFCHFLGHKRRKRVNIASPGVSAAGGSFLECPRCKDRKAVKPITKAATA